MTARALLVTFAVASAACSSSSSDGGGAPSSGTSTPTLDRSKKMSAMTADDYPLVCDAQAANEGGYGAAVVKKDCGNAIASETPPTSQADCVARLKSQASSGTGCNATIGAFLDCHAALYMNPCATLGEAPSCNAALDPACSAF